MSLHSPPFIQAQYPENLCPSNKMLRREVCGLAGWVSGVKLFYNRQSLTHSALLHSNHSHGQHHPGDARHVIHSPDLLLRHFNRLMMDRTLTGLEGLTRLQTIIGNKPSKGMQWGGRWGVLLPIMLVQYEQLGRIPATNTNYMDTHTEHQVCKLQTYNHQL